MESLPQLVLVLYLSRLAHWLGDYGTQNGWMALGKLRRNLPAIAHGVVYGLSYVATSLVFCWIGEFKNFPWLVEAAARLRHPSLVFAIAITHALVDRFAIAYHWYRVYNGYRHIKNDHLEPWQKIICTALDQGIHLWCDTVFIIFFWS